MHIYTGVNIYIYIIYICTGNILIDRCLNLRLLLWCVTLIVMNRRIIVVVVVMVHVMMIMVVVIFGRVGDHIVIAYPMIGTVALDTPQ